MPQQIFGFGSFQLNVTERQLTCHTVVIRLHAKVFDTLVVMLNDPGRLLRKETLMRSIWPSHVVEENNLQHNICVLRRTLAQHDSRQFIETVPGQGYRFAAEVHILDRAAPADPLARPKPAPALLAMQSRASQLTTRVPSAPRWPAVALNDVERVAALSARLDELRRSFRQLAGELDELELSLQQGGALRTSQVRENLVLP